MHLRSVFVYSLFFGNVLPWQQYVKNIDKPYCQEQVIVLNILD